MMTECLAEEELFTLVRGRSLADVPAVEAHVADCAACNALVALIARAGSTITDAAIPDPAAWNARTGTALGPYRLEAQIGTGGMGTVYRARDVRLGRAVAVKVLHATDPARLATEARAAAIVEHPNVVAIHDVGVMDGVTYVVMELVEGEMLRSVLERGPLPAERARELALELANGLAAAHARGVVHRDLKPENLAIAGGSGGGHLKILDFGLAKRAGASPAETTPLGTVMGTAGYMAPEQARGATVDARADLFALGAILFEMITGRRAFDGATYVERVSAILNDTPKFDALGPFAPIVERCLAKDPRLRFHSAADLAWVLSTLKVGSPVLPPQPQAPAASPSLRVPSSSLNATRSGRIVLAGTVAFAIAAAVSGYLMELPRLASSARPERGAASRGHSCAESVDSSAPNLPPIQM